MYKMYECTVLMSDDNTKGLFTTNSINIIVIINYYKNYTRQITIVKLYYGVL